MAYKQNKKNIQNNNYVKDVKEETVTSNENIDESDNESNAMDNSKIAKKTVAKKTYSNTDGIPCSSIFPGELMINGLRTGSLYRWVNYGDIIDVEYQDLIAAIRAANPISAVMKPYFIILDDEIVEQNPSIKKLYSTLYKDTDLKEILNTSPDNIKKIIPTLPAGAIEALKTIASTMVSNGTLDSINKIKVLDEVFGTQLILLTNLNN